MDFALILDIVVLTILLLSCVVAFLRGLVREVLTILGFGGAGMTAFIGGPKMAPGIEGWLTADLAADSEAKLWGFVPYDIAAMAFAYVGLFVITLVVMSVVSHYIAKTVHAVGLGAVDRSLGVVFGVLRGLVLIGLLYMPFHILMEDKDKDEWFGQSHSFDYVEQTSQFMTDFMPESWSRETGEDMTNDESAAEGDSEEEEVDPLKNLTGEKEVEQKEIDKPATSKIIGQETIENGVEALNVLIENQDKIQNMIQGQMP